MVADRAASVKGAVSSVVDAMWVEIAVAPCFWTCDIHHGIQGLPLLGGTRCCMWLCTVCHQEGWNFTMATGWYREVEYWHGQRMLLCWGDADSTDRSLRCVAITECLATVWHGCPSSRVQIIHSVSFWWWLTGQVERWQCCCGTKAHATAGLEETPEASASCCTSVLCPFWGC